MRLFLLNMHHESLEFRNINNSSVQNFKHLLMKLRSKKILNFVHTLLIRVLKHPKQYKQKSP